MNAHAPQPTYYDRLRLSLEDKLFFAPRLPEEVTLFADFGCGDGSLLAAVPKFRSNATTVGFDKSIHAVHGCGQRGVVATTEFGLFADTIAVGHEAGHKSCLILSSVVHEVLSVEPSFTALWSRLRALGCDYIAIRDMAVETDAFRRGPDAKITEAVCRDPSMAHFLTYGTREPGTFANHAELLEGLLKIEYRDNWMLEYAERYFPLTAEQWHNLTTVGSGYKLRHFEHTTSRYHQIMWRERLGIDVQDPTHIKLILKKV